tara:strand:- start:599 stop:802 length:204 start_codon:yes stop_codon:yes gene_type:complete
MTKYYEGQILLEDDLKNKELAYKKIESEDLEYYEISNAERMVKFIEGGKEIICAEYFESVYRILAIV